MDSSDLDQIDALASLLYTEGLRSEAIATSVRRGTTKSATPSGLANHSLRLAIDADATRRILIVAANDRLNQIAASDRRTLRGLTHFWVDVSGVAASHS